MKLSEAAALADLRLFAALPQREKTTTAQQLSREIFAEAEHRGEPFQRITASQWARKWLPSKRFRLMRLPLTSVALPCEPKGSDLVLGKIHARQESAIICDYNVNQIGKALHGFTPSVIVIDGKHRFQAAALRGDTHILAWVGEEAIQEMDAASQRRDIRAGKKGK